MDQELGRCALFIQKRGRYCRLAVARGSKYCGEHLTFDPEGSSKSQKKRIPCPLDPHHTVYEHLLEVHLTKCNAARKGMPACYRANINTGIPDYQLSEEEKKPLSVFPQCLVDSVIAKALKIYEDHRCHIEEVILEHPAMNSDLSDPVNGVTALKHIRQQASILGHLEKLNLFQPHTCFIEFGAGRGKLSHCVQRVCVEDETIHYLLVDRASCRRKRDVYRRGDPGHEARVQRLNIDIEHLDLGRVECLHGDDVRHIVAISKHLCGPATDLTLRCLLQSMSPPQQDDVTLHHRISPKEHQSTESKVAETQDDPMEPQQSTNDDAVTVTQDDSQEASSRVTLPSGPPEKLRAVVIALCCHHRCSWPQLTGTLWLRGCGLSPLDVHIITKMTSWAVCGVRCQDHKDPDHYDNHDTSPNHDLTSVEPHITTETSSTHHISTESNSIEASVAKATDPAHHIPSTESHSKEPKTISPGITKTTSSAHPNITKTTGSAHPNITKTTSSTHPNITKITGSAHPNITKTTSPAHHPPSYHPHHREGVGLVCKRLLDLARLHYLRERGVEGTLVYFVSRATSLENVLLIATPDVK